MAPTSTNCGKPVAFSSTAGTAANQLGPGWFWSSSDFCSYACKEAELARRRQIRDAALGADTLRLGQPFLCTSLVD